MRPRIPIDQRLWARIAVGGLDDCWIWQKGVDAYGYGQINEGGSRGRCLRAHRVAWTLTHGPIPDGMHVLHKCDTPRCCNPAHLFLGTGLDNIADCVSKGRHIRGENSPRAKLSESEVAGIRARLAAGDTQSKIADSFGVRQTSISHIKTGATWKIINARP